LDRALGDLSDPTTIIDGPADRNSLGFLSEYFESDRQLQRIGTRRTGEVIDQLRGIEP
jgi:hypothetical protein